MTILNLIIIAIPLIALVTALVEVAKKTFNIKKRYLPITSVVIGILFAVLLVPIFSYSLYIMIIVGLIAGLAASGTFDALKALKEGEPK